MSEPFPPYPITPECVVCHCDTEDGIEVKICGADVTLCKECAAKQERPLLLTSEADVRDVVDSLTEWQFMSRTELTNA